MSTQTIPRPHWQQFLDEFSRAHQGWLITLEAVGPRALPSILMHDVPLLGVTEEHDDLVIATSVDSSHTDKIVEKVVAVRVDRSDDGADRALELETADRHLLRLRFRSVMRAELVDGMSPT
jgi:uncharacterized protein DUF5335